MLAYCFHVCGFIISVLFRYNIAFASQTSLVSRYQISFRHTHSEMICGCTCFQVLSSLVEGVQRLSLKAGPGINGVTAVVVFATHHAASMAKKTLSEGKEPGPQKLLLHQQWMNIDLNVLQWSWTGLLQH